MKESKEYKISRVLFVLAIILGCISLVTGLLPNLVFSIDKISMFLCFAFLGLGLAFLKKAKDNHDSEDKE